MCIHSYGNLKCAANEFYLQFLKQRKNALSLKKQEELRVAGYQIFWVSCFPIVYRFLLAIK